MIMFSMRCKERGNALSIIIYFQLTYVSANSPNTGAHSAGHFYDNFLSLLLLPLYVWKQSIPEHCVLSTGVTQDSSDIMWLKVSRVNDCYSVIVIFLNQFKSPREMEPLTKSHVNNDLMKLPGFFSAHHSPVPAPSLSPTFFSSEYLPVYAQYCAQWVQCWSFILCF